MEKSEKYLGSHLLLDSSKRSSLQFLIQKVDTKLSGCKAKLLSHARRMILIKSVLVYIPVYHMATNIPKDIYKKI